MHALASLLVRLDSITLPNLMSDRKVFPEMVSVGREGPAIDFLTRSIDACDFFAIAKTTVTTAPGSQNVEIL